MIADLYGELWCKGGDYVVESRLLDGDSSCCELGFHLGEPHLGVVGPEGRKFNVDSCHSGFFAGHVTNA